LLIGEVPAQGVGSIRGQTMTLYALWSVA